MIEDPAGRIDYEEDGSGPAILFVPGSWGTRSAWRQVIAPLKGRYRIVTTSLLGYGRTDERRTSADASIGHELDVVEAVLRRVGGVAHIVGHSYGAVVSLAMALREAGAIASLSLIEPPLFSILRKAGEPGLFAEMSSMTDAYFHDYASGENDAARRVIDFYGGEGSFAALPDAFRNYVVETTPTNILDWASAIGFDRPLDALATIAAPTLIMRGDRGHPAVKRVAEILRDGLPRASLVTLADASHFMIMTHAPEVAQHIDRHISSVERQRA
jgi:pimeloyl-ACP methyl ester carboxylesterase